MLKKIFIFLSLFIFSNIQAQAFEDYLIISDSKLVDIRIDNNKIIDVYPLITVMNEKNILVVHPLTTGTTRFSLLKNDKERVNFHVYVENDKTHIGNVDGFNILALDEPPTEEFELDLPPVLGKPSNIGGQ